MKTSTNKPPTKILGLHQHDKDISRIEGLFSTNIPKSECHKYQSASLFVATCLAVMQFLYQLTQQALCIKSAVVSQKRRKHNAVVNRFVKLAAIGLGLSMSSSILASPVVSPPDCSAATPEIITFAELQAAPTSFVVQAGETLCITAADTAQYNTGSPGLQIATGGTLYVAPGATFSFFGSVAVNGTALFDWNATDGSGTLNSSGTFGCGFRAPDVANTNRMFQFAALPDTYANPLINAGSLPLQLPFINAPPATFDAITGAGTYGFQGSNICPFQPYIPPPPPNAFTCEANLYQIYSGQGQLSTIDLLNNTLNNFPNSAGYDVNAIGYRTADNFIYGIRQGAPRRVVRIDSTGAVTVLGSAVPGLPSITNQGDFAADGFLHVRSGSGAIMYRIDVTTQTIVSSYTLSPNLDNLSDITFNPVTGLFYGLGLGTDNNLYSIDPTSGATQDLGSTGIGVNSAFGAAFGDASGALYFARNQNGDVYRITLPDTTAVRVGRGAPATTNDGAFCHSATYVPPSPSLELTKSADTSALSSPLAVGDTITYTFEVENTGDLSLDLGTTPINDTMNLGADGTGASVSLTTGPTLVAATDTNGNGRLDVGETFQYTATFDLTQAALDAGGVHNTASSTGNPVNAAGDDIPGLTSPTDTSDNDATGDGTDGADVDGDATAGNGNATVVSLPNSPPVADNDGEANPTIGTPTVVDVLANDSDDDGNLDPATVQIVGTANPGDPLVVVGEGEWTVNQTTGEITFTPEAGFIGDPTVIRYTVDDNDGETSNIATVTVTYGEPPIAVDDNEYNPIVGSTTVVDILANDSDLDGTLVPATVQIVGTTNPGDPLVVPGEGEWTVDPATGAISFIPEAGFMGDPTPIQYTVDDDAGNTSNPAAVNVTYGVAPIASPIGEANPVPGTPTSVDIIASDADGTVDPTTVQIIDPNTGNPVTTLTVAGEGEWVVDAVTGEITFTPLPTFTGDPTPISYTVDDNDGNTSNPATVTVTYGDAPEATDDTQHNPLLGSDTVISVLTNDNDDGTLVPTTIQIGGTTVAGESLIVPGEGTWSIDQLTGEITFSPLLGYTGDPTPITYTVEDDAGNLSNEATVTVTYGEAPVATDDNKENPVIGSPTVVDLVSNDGDNDGTLDLDSVQLAGTANPGDPLTVPNEGVWTVNPGTGSITFTPDPGFTGDPTPIGYTISDNDGNVSNQAIVTVTYGEPPVADNDGEANPTVGTPTVVDVLANDSDADGTLDPATVQIVGTANPGDPLVVAGEGEWTVNQTTGEITFIPESGFIGDPTVIRYTVDDNEGNTSNPATVTVTYGEPPLATDDNAHNPVIGSTTVVDILANDSDLDGTLVPATVQIVGTTNPGDPLVVAGEGEWTVNPTTGAISFIPEAGFTGDPTPIQYIVEDDDGNVSNPAAVNVTYGDAPVANPDGAANPLLGSPTVINVTGTDNDPDGTVDPTTVQIIDPITGEPIVTSTLIVAEGVWSVNPLTGEITFTPDPNYTGDPDPAPISYTVEDNDGNLSNPATVTVTYGDAPEATDDMQHNPLLGSDTVINVLANDNDPDGTLDPATIEIVGSAGPGLPLITANGTWSVDTTTGAITFSPNPGFTGDPAPIQYSVEDDAGNPSNLATITVTYGEAPVATDDAKENPTIGSPTVVDLVSNDGDNDGTLDLDSVQLAGTANPGDPLPVAGGVWTVNAGTGSITFTPDPGFTGNPAPIGYTISDDAGNVSNQALVTVTYGLPPVAVSDNATATVSASSGQPVMIDVISGSDSDPEGMIDPSSVDLDPSTPGIDNIFTNADGTYTVDAFGVVTFTPVPGLSQSPQPISYTVNDIYGNTSNVASITITYAAEAIPTLSEWALIMLIMLLGFVGYRHSSTRGVKRKAF